VRILVYQVVKSRNVLGSVKMEEFVRMVSANVKVSSKVQTANTRKRLLPCSRGV